MGHTPGPWETQERDDRERGIAVIAVLSDVPIGGTPTRGMVAWVGQGGANFGKPAVQEANARLIAAAPDLLAALYLAYDNLDDALHGRRPRTNDLTLSAAIRAAIAKAEGR